MWGTSGYFFKSFLGQIGYLITSIFLMIVLLNLVISVVADTYDKVNMTRKQTDYLIKCGMLKDLSVLVTIFRDLWPCGLNENTKLEYLHICKKVRYD